jgi:hypothetical protein
MDLLRALGRKDKEVQTQKLKDDITKLSEELSTGIIELSDKAKKLNELKDKYKQVQSEVETTKPVKGKSFLSNLLGLSEDDDPPASPTNQPIYDDNLQESEGNINPDMLSAASTEQEQAQSPTADQSFTDVSQTVTSNEPLRDYNSISSNSVGSDAMQTVQAPVPAPAATPNAAAASSPDAIVAPAPASAPASAPAAAAVVAPLQTPQMPQGLPEQPTQHDEDDSTINIGGKNRKKSKRSKKTIRKSAKKLNKVTKKQKSNNAYSGDDKAHAQGLAQALLEAQGQS